MDESAILQRRRPTLPDSASPFPLLFGAKVHQLMRFHMHRSSVAERQLGYQVRHDTPVNAWGTTPDAQTSDRVETRETGGGAMNATLTSPELTRADRCDRCGA